MYICTCAFIYMYVWIYNLEPVLNARFNYWIYVVLTSGNFFSQLVCVPYEWRLRILIIVIVNAIVSVLMEVRNSNEKCLLLSVSPRLLVCLWFRFV